MPAKGIENKHLHTNQLANEHKNVEKHDNFFLLNLFAHLKLFLHLDFFGLNFSFAAAAVSFAATEHQIHPTIFFEMEFIQFYKPFFPKISYNL